MSPANIEHSIRQKLLNLSRQRHVDYNLMLIWYAQERLLYRLSRSSYAKAYILKGAMLFSVWSKETFRPTKDLDFLGQGESSGDYLKKVFTEIIQGPVDDDGLIYLPESLEVHPIREEQAYGGQRISLMAKLGNARIRLQVDVGFGDAITPSPQKVKYPVLLDMAAPTILAYNRETVIAEKFHALSILGINNSRMKDYYDLWVLCQQYEFKGDLLSQAIMATFKRRDTDLPAQLPLALIEECYKDKVIMQRWQAFLAKTTLSQAEDSLEKVALSLQEFFTPVIQSFSDESGFKKHWDKQKWI